MHAPGVAIVHDRFHMVHSVNKALDEVRRKEQARLEGNGKNVIKGSRFLLLKGKENLNQGRRTSQQTE